MGIENFPIVKMTLDEIMELVIPSVEGINLSDEEVGFKFRCTPSVDHPEMLVVGELVKGDDLLCDQWGGGLTVPTKGVNRYRIEVTGSDEDRSAVLAENLRIIEKLKPSDSVELIEKVPAPTVFEQVKKWILPFC